MEIAILDLQIQFSQKNNFESSASSSKRRAIDGLRLVSEFSKKFMSAEAMEEEERRLQKGMGKRLLTDSKSSSSNKAEKTSLMNTSKTKVCRNPHKCKEVSQANEVEQICQRLRVLEQQTNIMKQEFYEHIEERRKLVHEIHRQFQTIRKCLQLRNQMEGGRTWDACFLLGHNDKEEGLRSGLSEVLHPNPSPRIVNRDQRTDILALLEAVDAIILHSQNG